MPWSHCDIDFILDDEGCPACGISKAEWTVQVEHTRLFVVGRSTWIELELADEEGRPLAGEPYRVVNRGGKVFEGELDAEGFARVDKVGQGPCFVSFPRIDVTAGAYALAYTPPPAKRPPQSAWLGLELVDDQGRPQAEEPFEVLLPDGRLVAGNLDASGKARLEDIPPGECEVRFPERDVRESAFVLAEVPPPSPEEAWTSAWLDIELVDDAAPARPVAGERYVVVCRDGSRREGQLDDQGQAQVDGLPPGECRVLFPDRDASEGRCGFDPPDVPAPPREPEVGWLALELVDDQEPPRPVANEPFVVRLPDGGQVEGTLDAQGRARIDKIPVGLCKVEFPGRDARDAVAGFVLPGLPPPPPPDPLPATGWLELELVEDDEPPRPAANERFEVVLPDGSRREGALDARGRARLDGLPAGRCEVRFPGRQATDLVGA